MIIQRIPLRNVFLSSFLVVIVLATMGYYGYTSFGMTSTFPLNPYSAYYKMTAGEVFNPGAGVIGGTALVSARANCTSAFSLDVYVGHQLVCHESSTGSQVQCSVQVRHDNYTIVLTNLSGQPATAGIYYNVDGQPIRTEQMLYAPLFTLVPVAWLLSLSSNLIGVSRRLGRRTLRLSYVFYLVLLPFLATFALVQLSLIAHSASGGAYIQPLEYYSIPLSYILPFLKPSQLLSEIVVTLAEIWPVYLVSAGVLALVIYAGWRRFLNPLSERLVGLSKSDDLVGLVSYYYLASVLFWVILMGIGVYGPESIAGSLSIPYAEPLIGALHPLSDWFSLSERSFRIMAYVMTLAVAIAALLRILLRLDARFPMKVFSKAVTFLWVVSLFALAASPKLAENYYFPLSAIGAVAIPFFALCIATGCVHWIVRRMLLSKRLSRVILKR
ncbi:MAG: hypothetical protein ABSG74_04565 [Candidatus Bathyarchaeia archaeon]